jgi:hypothetical protein
MFNNDTWKLVQEKQVELRQLTDANWKNGEWELAALGERTLRTVEHSTVAVNMLRRNMLALNREVNRLEQQNAA